MELVHASWSSLWSKKTKTKSTGKQWFIKPSLQNPHACKEKASSTTTIYVLSACSKLGSNVTEPLTKDHYFFNTHLRLIFQVVIYQRFSCNCLQVMQHGLKINDSGNHVSMLCLTGSHIHLHIICVCVCVCMCVCVCSDLSCVWCVCVCA